MAEDKNLDSEFKKKGASGKTSVKVVKRGSSKKKSSKKKKSKAKRK